MAGNPLQRKHSIKFNTKNSKNLKADYLKSMSFPLLVFIVEKEDNLFSLLSSSHVLGSYSYLHLSVKVSSIMAIVQVK